MARFELKNPPLRSQARGVARVLWTRACALFALALGPGASTAHAHSQPGVSGILDEDANGVHVLRLYQGLVQRDGSSWRFVCSKTYSGGGQDLAGSLPGGGVAIAIPTGISIMKRDGTVAVHPDPEAQQGTLTAFARTPNKLFALRWRDRLLVSDVVEISETTVKVIWTDTHYWSDIAVGETGLVLVRIEQDEIEDLRLSFAGEVVSEEKAPLTDVLAVSVRVMGDVPYYAARLQNSSVLGRIEQGAWKQLLTSGNFLAGPMLMPDGTALVALDGVLSTFANDVATPLSESDFVTGLYQLDDHPYACTRTGVRDLTSTGLGDSLFDLSQLLGPNECMVPEESRSDCELEWQHLLVELLGANIPLASEDTSAKVCSAAGETGAVGADSGTNGSQSSGPDSNAGAGGVAQSESAPDASGMQTAAADAGVSNASTAGAATSGCACGSAPRAQRGAAAIWGALLLACGLILRRRRK